MPKLSHGFLLLLFAIILLPTGSVVPVAGIGEEQSGYQALAIALAQKWTFGQDIIFKNGPLAFLDNGFLPESVHVGARLIFDIYIFLNLLFIVHYSLKRTKKPWVTILGLLFILVPKGQFADSTFTLLFLFLFNLFHANENHRSFSLYNAVFIAALMFFIKINFSLVISLLLYFTLIYLWATARFSWREVLAVFITHLFLIYWGAYHLKVAIGSYLANSLHIIQNYSDYQAMLKLSQPYLGIALVLAFIITGFALIIFFKNFKQVYKRHDYLFTFAMVFIAMYLSFKQQFTEISAANAMEYFLFIPPILSLLWLFLRDSDRWFSRLAFVTVLICAIGYQLMRFEASNSNIGYLEGFLPKERAYFKNKYGSLKSPYKPIEYEQDALAIVAMHSPYFYIKSLLNNKFETIYPKFNWQNRLLPKTIKEHIGTSTIDIIPNEVSYIFYNKLNYTPRPCIQSSQVSNGYLDSLNAVFYKSNKGPKYVFFQFKKYQIRNSFWEETLTKNSLISHFEYDKTVVTPQKFAEKTDIINDTLLLLRKRTTPLKEIETKLKKLTTTFEKTIALPQTQHLLQIKVNINYSWQGKLFRGLFQTPFLYCEIQQGNNTWQKYRITLPILENGIVINKLINSHITQLKYFQNKGNGYSNIKAVKFTTERTWGYQPNIQVSFAELKYQ